MIEPLLLVVLIIYVTVDPGVAVTVEQVLLVAGDTVHLVTARSAS